MDTTRRALLAGATILAAAALPFAASAQTAYPSKPITLLVPTGAGGPTDTVARLIGESMSKTLGQTVIVENVPGAGGTIGMARVAKSDPDGYTISIWHIAHATAPSLYANLKYDVVKDFDHIGRITDVPMTIVSKAALPVTNVTELVDWIRKDRDKITYAHAGIGSAAHLCMLMFMKELGVPLKGVSYKGTGPAMNDLLGGQFDIMCDQTTNTTNQIKDGKIKGFAVTTKTKVSSLPELPTLDSGAIKGFDVSAWHAMWAPKGLPKDISDKIVAALQVALKDARVKERFASLGTEPVAAAQATPEALKAHVEAEVPRWNAAIKAGGVKAE